VYYNAFFLNLPLALLTATLWLGVAFATSKVVQRHAIIDVFWGSGFLVVFLESLLVSRSWSHGATTAWWNVSPHGATLHQIVLVLVGAWALRLSIHLALRQRGHGEDPRYVYIMKGARGRNENLYALQRIYFLQAGLMWFVSLPLQWIAFAPALQPAVTLVGALLILLGLSFEATGDEQLRRFIANPASVGTTMNRGLWRYTRHPNYFGDAVVWWGIFIVALASGWGVFTLLSPLLMTRLLTSISGVPLLERKLARTRAGYEEYIAVTSSFLPRPPRKSSRAS
jgi:steroid 5-alpha reductase family enzyme